MNATKDPMEPNENREERKSHVIEKIRRISIAMDRGESWTWILLTSMLAVVLLGLVYYMFK
jgi:hypothetical protein